MDFKPISFEGFVERDVLLANIKRYSMYKTMFFRTNVDWHTRRAQWIAEELYPSLKMSYSFDIEKLRALCRVHDDAEIITGDIQLGRKMYIMEKEKLEQLDKEEERAETILASRWPKMLHGYGYCNLLIEARKKETTEAQIMKVIDRFDAFGESLHEIYSGNLCFLTHSELPDCVNPVQTYTMILRETKQRYPLVKDILNDKHPLLSPPIEINPEQIARQGQLPTLESIKRETGNAHYDSWKKITIEYGGEEGLRWLIEQREFA